MTTHSTTFRCEECGVGFKRKSCLKVHSYKHRPEIDRPHPCPNPDCQRRFVTNQDLDRHRRTHDSSKGGYACQQCNKAFRRSSALKRHVAKSRQRGSCEALLPNMRLRASKERVMLADYSQSTESTSSTVDDFLIEDFTETTMDYSQDSILYIEDAPTLPSPRKTLDWIRQTMDQTIDPNQLQRTTSSTDRSVKSWRLKELTVAMEDFECDKLKAMLYDGCTPRFNQKTLNEALHYAVEIESCEAVRVLSEATGDPNSRMKSEILPLCFAIRRQNESLVRTLLDVGAHVYNESSSYFENPLYVAFGAGVPYGIASLVATKINSPVEASVALLSAAMSRDILKARLLIDHHGANVNFEDICDETALNQACRVLDFPMVKLLVAVGADVNKQAGFNRTAPIHALCSGSASGNPKSFKEFKEILDHLLPQITDLMLESEEGTALQIAFRKLDNTMLQYLIAAGA